MSSQEVVSAAGGGVGGGGGGGGLYHLMFCNFDIFLSFFLSRKSAVICFLILF